MTPSSDSTHSLVSSGSMSGSWLGSPSLITGRLRSVATGNPLGQVSEPGGPLCESLGQNSILPLRGGHRHAYPWCTRSGTHVLTSNFSAVDEAEPDLPGRVVAVGIDQTDRLPGAERDSAAHHGECRVRRDPGRQHVIAPVAAGTVPVPPAVLGRQQLVDRGEQVVVRAGA